MKDGSIAAECDNEVDRRTVCCEKEAVRREDRSREGWKDIPGSHTCTPSGISGLFS